MTRLFQVLMRWLLSLMQYRQRQRPSRSERGRCIVGILGLDMVMISEQCDPRVWLIFVAFRSALVGKHVLLFPGVGVSWFRFRATIGR